VSAGWGRFQDEGAGPDWLAAAGEDAAGEDAAGGSAAPDWAAAAEPDTDSAPSGWASLADAAGGRTAAPKPSRSGRQRESSGGFGEDRRGGSASQAKKTAAKKTAAKKAAAKKANGGWSSRRKDRDPAHAGTGTDTDTDTDTDADKPKPPLSREKLEQRAKNILMYHLGRQMQTRSQLADRLRKKEIPEDVAEAVLDRFEELHLLNDTDYAETFVRSRHNERGLAKRALGYELRKRGIDDETAAEALSTLDEDQEAGTARRLVDSRLRATKGLDPQVRTRRLVGMLARKGYSSSVAFRVVKEALAEEGLDVELGDPGFD
jgi:regulatory protein